MLRTRVGYALVVLLSSSCAASAPASSDTLVQPAPSPIEAGSASRPAPSPAPAPAGPAASAPARAHTEPAGAASCEKVEHVDVAAFWQPLFDKGRRLRYAVKDDVDPHAPDGGRSVTKGAVTCVVASLCRFHGGMVSSELACTDEPGASSVLGSDRVAFLERGGALWMVAGAPADEEAAQKAVAGAPLLPAKPGNSRRTFDEPGMFEGERDACVETVEIAGPVVCREVRCTVKRGYGNSEDRRCFTATGGLWSWRRVNLAGPRTTTWELLDSRLEAPRVPKE